MKPHRFSPWIRSARCCAATATVLCLGAVHAADFTWDADPATAGNQDGGGTWNNANTNWTTGGANATFPAATAYIVRTVSPFAATDSTITVNNLAGLAVGQEFNSAFFPAGTVIGSLSGTTGAGTITLVNPTTLAPVGATGAQTAATNVNFQAPLNTATIGSGNGAAGTINLASPQIVRDLTLAPAGSGTYTFTGSPLTIGSIVYSSTLTVGASARFENQVTTNALSGSERILFTAQNQTLTFAGGGNILAVSGSNAGITGSDNAIRQSSTVLASGIFTGNSGATWNIGNVAARTGGVQISGAGTTASFQNIQLGTSGGGGYASFAGGAVVTLTGQGTVGRAGSTALLSLDGTGTRFIHNNTNGGETSFAIGREGGNGTVEVTNGARLEVTGNGTTSNGGGTISINSQSTSAASVGTLNIVSGTVIAKDIRLNGTNQFVANAPAASTAGTAILNLQSSGALYLGGLVRESNSLTTTGGTIGDVPGGLSQRGGGTSTYQVNLNGGTLGATTAWTSSVRMTLGTGTNTNLKAASEGNVAADMTFTGQLTGSGGWTKTGGGTLTLNSSTIGNNFTGGSTINAGTVTALAASSFGAGNVTVGAATLNLRTLATIADTAGLYFGTGSVINLDYTGTEVVSAISNGTLSLGPGTYTVADLTTQFGAGIFSSSTGLGTLTIIPEPTSAALLGLGVVSLAFSRRRKSDIPV